MIHVIWVFSNRLQLASTCISKYLSSTKSRSNDDKVKVNLQSQCTNLLWRPGDGENQHQILSLHYLDRHINLIDIRRPFLPIGVFKIDGRQSDDGENKVDDIITCFTVANDGKSMYAGTSDGVVHHFVFRSNNELYTNVLENLPKTAIAVSPWGDVTISSSSKRPMIANKISEYESISNEPPPIATAPDDFVAARDFRWRQRTRVSRTVGKTSDWWKDSTNEETVFAAQLFFSKITHSKRLETKHVLDTAKKLKMPNQDFFELIMEYLDREERIFASRNFTEKPGVSELEMSGSDSDDRRGRIPSCSDSDELGRSNLTLAQYQHNGNGLSHHHQDEHDESDHEYKYIDMGGGGWDPDMHPKSCISESSVTRREIASDGSAINDESDPEDRGDKFPANERRKVGHTDSKRVSRDDNRILLNRDMNYNVILQQQSLRLLAEKIALLGQNEGLQPAIIAICLLGEDVVKEITEQKVGRRSLCSATLLEHWFHDYFELISRNGLFQHKAAICRIAPLDKIKKMLPSTSGNVRYNIGCGRCKKILDKTSNGVFCRSCKRFVRCDVCRYPVEKLMKICRLCGHGGHIKHYNEWFRSRDQCMVAACDCKCKLQSS